MQANLLISDHWIDRLFFLCSEPIWHVFCVGQDERFAIVPIHTGIPVKYITVFLAKVMRSLQNRTHTEKGVTKISTKKKIRAETGPFGMLSIGKKDISKIISSHAMRETHALQTYPQIPRLSPRM